MRWLVVTDTHGDMDVINTLIERTQADACLHCGDFGFYDADSVDRLEERELRLRWKHSDLPAADRRLAFEMERGELVERMRAAGLLSTFVPYLEGARRFLAPVYAVWGNHEDAEVVKALRDGALTVENLHVVDEHSAFELGEGVTLFGCGGNFYAEGEGLFTPGLTGRGGKVRGSFVQLARVLERMRASRSPVKLLMTHVSPGKVRLLERLALVGGATVALSGHMGPPNHNVWSLFTICEPEEAMARSAGELAHLRALWASSHEARALSASDRAVVERALEWLDVPALEPPERGRRAPKGSLLDRYRATTFVNLTDADRGWGVLEVEGESVSWQGHLW